jgi:hypothetical protein
MIAACRAFQGQASCLFDFDPDPDLDIVRLMMGERAAKCVSMFSKASHSFILLPAGVNRQAGAGLQIRPEDV